MDALPPAAFKVKLGSDQTDLVGDVRAQDGGVGSDDL